MKITYLRNWYVSSSTQSKGITVDSDVYLSVIGDCGGTCDNDEIARIDERYPDALKQRFPAKINL